MKTGNDTGGQKSFDATSEQQQDGLILRITGELDANTAVAADDTLTAALAQPIRFLLIDCNGLRYVSSAGLGVFLSAFHTCQQTGIPFILFGLQPKIKNVFSILGLERVMQSVQTEQEALQLANASDSGTEGKQL
ncbi:STAS domain-containing protein [Pontibacter actiniarum]|nr:STAS domain-containing protein [Pontibacter actiniarum]